MALAPSFSPPMFLMNASNVVEFSPQHHERRRRVTLVHSKTAPARLESMARGSDKKKKKGVRFHEEEKLEQVRFFLKTQAPSAIRDGDPSSLPLAIELQHINWPDKMMMRSSSTKTTRTAASIPSAMIRMENVQIATSSDTSVITLVGRCRVANLAFQKHVVVRYTTNYWQSFHETEAMYREPIGSSANTWDRFSFQIDLAPVFFPAITTLYLALRYTVNDTDYWDNNGGLNYQMDITVRDSTEPKRAGAPPDEDSDGVVRCQEKEEEEGHEEKICEHGISRSQHPSVDQTRLDEKEPKRAEQSAPSVAPMSRRPSSPAAIAMTKLFPPPALSIEPLKHVVAAKKKKLGLRYDFGASLSEAKKVTSYPPSSEGMPYRYPFVGRGLFEQHHVAPAAEVDSKSDDYDDDMLQLRYRDIIAKYCFYGNTAAPSSPPPAHPPSLSPCPSPEPICG